jgi:hypothetical protein
MASRYINATVFRGCSSMSADIKESEKRCGGFCCGNAADYVIDHPTRGELYACEGCACGYEVVRRV